MLLKLFFTTVCRAPGLLTPEGRAGEEPASACALEEDGAAAAASGNRAGRQWVGGGDPRRLRLGTALECHEPG